MTTFEKNNVVLNISIDGKFLYVLNVDNGNTTPFQLELGIRISNISSSEIGIEQVAFPNDGYPFVIEISNRWPSISYDPSRDLIFICGVGVGMDVVGRIDSPEYEDSYSSGVNIKTYFTDLTQHQLFINSQIGKILQFRSQS